MKIISIDPSKYSTGIYTRINGVESSFTVTNEKKSSSEEVLINIYNIFSKLLTVNYKLGLIEGYGFNPKNKHGITTMTEIVGVIKLTFAQANIPLVVIPIQIWKKYTIGRIDKKQVKDYMRAIHFKYEREFETTDEADAFLIYQATKNICKTLKGFTPAVKKIRDRLKQIIGERRWYKKEYKESK